MSGLASKRYWRNKKVQGEWAPEGLVSEQELLNRVILTKALQVYASNRTMHLKTRDGDFEITRRVAVDVITASGKWPAKKLKLEKYEKK